MKGLAVGILVFCTFVCAAHGLKCYVCAGTEEMCSKDKLKDDKSKQLDCTSALNKCMRVWVKDGDVAGVVQSCANDAMCDKGCDNAKGTCKVGCCDTDLCNAGSPVSFSVFLMTVCSALGLALLK